MGYTYTVRQGRVYRIELVRRNNVRVIVNQGQRQLAERLADETVRSAKADPQALGRTVTDSAGRSRDARTAGAHGSTADPAGQRAGDGTGNAEFVTEYYRQVARRGTSEAARARLMQEYTGFTQERLVESLRSLAS